MELTDSEDEFAVFNLPLSSDSSVQVDNLQRDIIVPKEMGIQVSQDQPSGVA